MFGAKAAPPPPPPSMSCELIPPSSYVWAEAVATFLITSALQVVLALTILLSPKPIRPALGIVVAAAFASGPFALLSHAGVDRFSAVTWFVLSSVGMTGFFKTIQAANGLFPPGAESLSELLGCFLAVPPQRWAERKPVKAAPGELSSQVVAWLSRFAGLSVCLSLLLHSDDHFPLGTASHAARLAGSFIQLWAVYLFLALLLDTGGVITLLQGISPGKAFHAPLLRSRCFQEARARLTLTPTLTLTLT